MEIKLDLFGFKFPEDNEKLIKLLNEDVFQGYKNWTHNIYGVEVYSPDAKLRHYSAQFIYETYLRFKEAEILLNQLMDKFEEHDCYHLEVNDSYYFVIQMTSNYPPESKIKPITTPLSSLKMIETLQKL